MKLLVTVGSDQFDDLVNAAASQLDHERYQVVYQIGQGKPPQNGQFFTFSTQFAEQVAAADVVISHGGAATIFELLEARKKLVLVPNFTRIDSHQQDLAHFVESGHYGKVCWQLSDLAACVTECLNTDFQPYQKDSFFLANDILDYFYCP